MICPSFQLFESVRASSAKYTHINTLLYMWQFGDTLAKFKPLLSDFITTISLLTDAASKEFDT